MSDYAKAGTGFSALKGVENVRNLTHIPTCVKIKSIVKKLKAKEELS